MPCLRQAGIFFYKKREKGWVCQRHNSDSLLDRVLFSKKREKTIFIMRVILHIICLLLTASLMGQSINKAEYFFDADPGVGNGINIPVSAAGTLVNLSEIFDFSGLSAGYHNVSVRVQDDNGLWSHAEGRRFYIEDEIVLPISTKIIAA